MAHSYRSHCAQVYNYHRLLSWDKERGLHVDIFKVPTCCSCQVDGYQQQFPPLTNSYKDKLQQSPALHSDLYSTLPDDLDYNEEDDDINFQSGFDRHRSQHKQYDTNELGTKNVPTKLFAPNGVTVGPYLSPPDSEEFDNYAFKSPSHISAAASNLHYNHHAASSTRRRPFGLAPAPVNEARVDLDFSPSENHADKEVNHIIGTTHAAQNNDKKSVATKRKRIYSVPHTAPTTAASAPRGGGGISGAAGRGSSANTGTGSLYRDSANIRSGSYSTALPPYTTTSNSNSIASHAHQASNTFHHTAPTFSSTQSKTINSGSNKQQQRTRFTRPSTSTTKTSSTKTQTSKATTPRTTPAPIYHVNSIYGVNYNGSHISNSRGTKRINYSYHPIIDFFESTKRTSLTTTTSTESTSLPIYSSSSSASSASEKDHHLYPLTIPKVIPNSIKHQNHENRFSAAALAGMGGPSTENRVRLGENAWQPVVATP